MRIKKELVLLGFLLISFFIFSLSNTIANNNKYFIRGDISNVKAVLYNFDDKNDKYILQNLVKAIEEYKDVPYRYGDSSETGFDCSGFVALVYRKFFNLKLPRGSRNIYKYGHFVPKNKLRPGDLLFFRMGKNIGHVGIYLGYGYFVSAESHKGKIGISHLDSIYWKKKYVGAKRILTIKYYLEPRILN